MTRSLAVVTMLLVAHLGLAAEAAHDHLDVPHKTVALGKDRILPDNLTMSSSDALVFENFSPAVLTIRFIEPENQIEKIRCPLAIGKIVQQGGELAFFRFDYKKRLIATVAPGRFASVCSLAPGQYSYTVEPSRTTKAGPSAGQRLSNKGTITVQ